MNKLVNVVAVDQRPPKILVIDIETRPAMAYVWGLFDQNIGLNQLIEPSRPICFAAKYVGEDEVFFFSEWDNGRVGMAKAAHALFCEADAVVGYNSDSFDIKKLMGEFLLAGLAPPPPLTSIDLLKTVRKLGFQSGKLAYVGPLLDIGGKVKTAGFELWNNVMKGKVKAQKQMRKYNEGDVTLTEKLYLKLLPYIKNHPHMGNNGPLQCGGCGSTKLHSRGFRRTKTFKIQRMQCQTCGSWSDGSRHKV